jgi:hypothetical protein
VGNDESEGFPAGREGTPAVPRPRVLVAVIMGPARHASAVPHDRNPVAKSLVEPVVVGELASFYNNAGHCSTRISGGSARPDSPRGSALDFLVRRRETAGCRVASAVVGHSPRIRSDGDDSR